MATKLEKPITRITPDIKDDQGRELVVTIAPSGEGGELLLHWNGDRKKEGDRAFSIRDLSQPEQQRPSGWGRWVRIEELKSQIQISAGLREEQKTSMCLIIDRLLLTEEWVSRAGDGMEWSEFLIKKGREDLLVLPTDEERPDIVDARDKRNKAREIKAKMTKNEKKQDPL